MTTVTTVVTVVTGVAAPIESIIIIQLCGRKQTAGCHRAKTDDRPEDKNHVQRSIHPSIHPSILRMGFDSLFPIPDSVDWRRKRAAV